MSLVVNRISFSDFRNYSSLALDGLGPLTIFCGRNAVGKTNIVEGIQLLTALASFRHPTVEQLVRTGAASARIEADVSDGNRELSVSCSIGEGKKRYALNGKAKRPHDLAGLVPSVAFTPDDLDLVKGAMSVRRAALDALGVQLSRNYYVVKRDYEQVVRYKNRLLKEEAGDDLVASINETLLTCGSALTCYRAALFGRLSPALSECYGEISDGGEQLRVRYVPSWEERPGSLWEALGGQAGESPEAAISRDDARAALERALAVRGAEERARRRAVVGPHADRVEFFIDGADASVYGSQGQQRSCVLAFKMAEVAAVESVLNQKPVLLLDDVMSELDEVRRRALVGFLGKDVQTFITTTNLSYFDFSTLGRARIIELPLKERAL